MRIRRREGVRRREGKEEEQRKRTDASSSNWFRWWECEEGERKGGL